MLRICIPVHNEATTIGVLLWRLRSVFQGFSREYDVVVYDDASTDGTGDVLAPYQSVMPLTVLRGAMHCGYAGSIDVLVRHVAADDEYARRDAMVLLQGDFTESPEHLPELLKRFEGGADLVAVHRVISEATPKDERRLRRWGSWAVKPFLRLPPISDPFTGFRLVRISVLRELLKSIGNQPVCAGEGWAANIDFALNIAPFARRIENVELAPRYDVRQRASRRRGWSDVVALFHWARAARKTTRPAPGGRPSADVPVRAEQATVISTGSDRIARPSPQEHRSGRGSRPAEVAVAVARDDRPPREARGAREERALRGEERGAERPERSAREPRPPRDTRAARPAREMPADPVDEVPARSAVKEATPKPPRPERPARPPREDRAAATIRVSAKPVQGAVQIEASEPAEELPSIAQFAPDGDPGPTLAVAGVEPLTEVAPEANAEKRKRRRRRSRRDRAAHGEGSSEEVDSSTDVTDDDAAGTSRGSEGQQETGDDDQDSLDAIGTTVEGSEDGVRRKRRPRRRRRGRRPDGAADAGGHDGSAPPAAEPPAA